MELRLELTSIFRTAKKNHRREDTQRQSEKQWHKSGMQDGGHSEMGKKKRRYWRDHIDRDQVRLAYIAWNRKPPSRRRLMPKSWEDSWSSISQDIFLYFSQYKMKKVVASIFTKSVRARRKQLQVSSERASFWLENCNLIWITYLKSEVLGHLTAGRLG